MHRKILAGILAGTSVLLVAQRSDAQFFSPSFSTSTYVDRIVQDAVRPEIQAEESKDAAEETTAAPEVGFKAVTPGEPGETPPVPEPKTKHLFKDRIYSLTYEYTHRNYSAQFNDLHSSVHLVLPELHLKSQNGFSLDLSAGYVRNDSQDEFRNVIDSDSFVLAVTPALELLGRDRDRCDLENPQLTFLTPGLTMGYRHSNLENVFAGVGSNSKFDALTLIPNVVLTQVTSRQTLVSAVAAYVYDTSGSDSEDFLANDGSEGIVSIAMRGDLYLPTLPLPCRRDESDVHLSATAAWKHYAQASVRSIPGDDSAEFSANLAVPIPLPKRTFTARIGYAYEAFREDYEAHRAQLYIEGPIWRE